MRTVCVFLLLAASLLAQQPQLPRLPLQPKPPVPLPAMRLPSMCAIPLLEHTASPNVDFKMKTAPVPPGYDPGMVKNPPIPVCSQPPTRPAWVPPPAPEKR